MSKKRKWFGYGGEKDDEYYKDLFSNSRKQHQEKLNNVTKRYDEDGFLIEDSPETDYLSDYSYDYGYKTSFKKKEYNFENSWDSYWKSGKTWTGYSSYKPATLSYKYVQQMANTLANQSGVRVQIGSSWDANIAAKLLTYNPTSLMYGTKGELLATLLHETGKIAHSTDSTRLKSEFLAKYNVNAKTALSVFEGVRIDMIMLKSYPSANEVYESNTGVVKKIIDEYVKNATIMREHLKQSSVDLTNRMIEHVRAKMQQANIQPDQMDAFSRIQFADITKQMFGKFFQTVHELKDHLAEYFQKQAEEPLLYEYIAEMLRLSYGIDMAPIDIVKQYVEPTYKHVAPASRLKSAQEVIDLMDNEVYPIIEKLLQQQDQGTEAQQEAFGAESAKALARDVANRMHNDTKVKDNHSLVDGNGKENARLGGGRSTEQEVPSEWRKGDYTALRESVDYEIKQLTNRLNFIKREESVERFTSNERRGKLDTRKLYRFATGNTRLFKRKLPKRDTVRSFAFSLLVDISGSMQDNNKIVHTLRGLIILAEVFEKFDIPYEIICFRGHVVKLKKFTDKLDKNMKQKIGGIINMVGGSTYLIPALEEVEVHKQPEANKICVVLSDGDTESHDELDQQFFVPWEKKGIKSIGVGIEVGERIKTLCHNNGIAIDHSNQLPTEFSNLLKKLIKR